MDKKRIFITSVGGDVACAALRCLSEVRETYEIIGCDINKYVQGEMYIDKFFVSPKYSDCEKYISFVCRICNDYKVDFFLPIGEQEIIIASQLKNFFFEHNIKLIAVNDYILEIATNKYKTYEMCKEIGILVPDTIRLADYRFNSPLPFEFPVIIKKMMGCGSEGMKRVETQGQFLEIVNDKSYDDEWIIQEEIGNKKDEYTMGIFSNGKSISHIAFRRKLGFGSMSVFVETVEDSIFYEIAEKIVKKTKLIGSINVQMRRKNNNYYIFEINPRISSSCRFRHLNGFKDVVWWLQYCDNRNPDISFSAIQGKIGIKILDEYMLENIHDTIGGGVKQFCKFPLKNRVHCDCMEAKRCA